MNNNIREFWNEALASTQAEYDADVFFYSGAIDSEGFGSIVQEMTTNRRHENALLILVTNGGLANSAYQIARLFQTQYRRFVVCCPGPCKSAGTLITLGANKLIMDNFSELGPLDVQLMKQNEIAARKSGLLSNASFDAMQDAAFSLYERLMLGITLSSQGNISFKLASELSASMASTMMTPVYAQLNPDVIGAEKRDLSIAFEYGYRLADKGGNASTETVYRLVHGYPSHDFIIDAEEAGELFQSVDYPSINLYKLIGCLGDAVSEEATQPIIRLLALVDMQEENEEVQNDEGSEEDEIDQPATGTTVDGGGEADWAGDPEQAEPPIAANTA